jgi:uncharacterized protein YPO0396
VSDTPRTDAEAFLPHDKNYRVCDADFARQLERELNAANDRIKRLEEALDCLTLVVGLTPVAGNKDALQEAVDLARAALRAKEAKP